MATYVVPTTAGLDNNPSGSAATLLDGDADTTFTFRNDLGTYAQAWWDYLTLDLTGAGIVGLRLEIDVVSTTPGNIMLWRLNTDSPDGSTSWDFGAGPGDSAVPDVSPFGVDTPGTYTHELDLASLRPSSSSPPSTTADLVAALVEWLADPSGYLGVPAVQTPAANPGPTVVSAIRLVAYTPTAHGIPPLRQKQRGDGLGMSGAPRTCQNNSQQASLRQFGFQ